MIIIGGKRRCGKTMECIKISAINQIPIVVFNEERKTPIKKEADGLKLKIPDPIVFKHREKFVGMHKDILIDDVDDILQDYFYGNKIIAATTSTPFKPMDELIWR